MAQDGGGVGIVKPIGKPVIGQVKVQWESNSKIFEYDRGFNGKVDLKCVEPALGGYYQPEWLPILMADIHSSKQEAKYSDGTCSFAVGDKVKIDESATNADQLRSKQAQYKGAGWDPGMEQVSVKLWCKIFIHVPNFNLFADSSLVKLALFAE